MNKSRHVTFRCTQEQYDAMKRDAGYCGMSVSALIVETYFERYPIGQATLPPTPFPRIPSKDADPQITPLNEPHDPEEYIRQLNELNGFDVVAYLKEHGELDKS